MNLARNFQISQQFTINFLFDLEVLCPQIMSGCDTEMYILDFTSNISFLIITLIQLVKTKFLHSQGPSKFYCTKLHCEYITLNLF